MRTHFSDFDKLDASGSDHLVVCAAGSLTTVEEKRHARIPCADETRTERVGARHDEAVTTKPLTSER